MILKIYLAEGVGFEPTPTTIFPLKFQYVIFYIFSNEQLRDDTKRARLRHSIHNNIYFGSTTFHTSSYSCTY